MARRVLIVDDSLRCRMELRDLLQAHGFSVAGEAAGGKEAVELYERIRPDLIMVDARMPDMDGVCTIRNIRRHHPNALAVVCGSSGEKSSVMEALTAGAADFCPKPYVPRRVVSILRRVLAGIHS